MHISLRDPVTQRGCKKSMKERVVAVSELSAFCFSCRVCPDRVRLACECRARARCRAAFQRFAITSRMLTTCVISITSHRVCLFSTLCSVSRLQVPLLVSLFSDCEPKANQEMVRIYQDNGEVVLTLGSSFKVSCRQCRCRCYCITPLRFSATQHGSVSPS